MLGLLLAAMAPQALAAELQVRDQRTRLLPSEFPAAGYFIATNTGNRPLVLVGAESAAFETVMIHKSTQKDGTASMEHIEELKLAPGESVKFVPRGHHLMLIKRLQSLSVGDRIPMTFLLSDGQRLQTVFRAVSPSAH